LSASWTAIGTLDLVTASFTRGNIHDDRLKIVGRGNYKFSGVQQTESSKVVTFITDEGGLGLANDSDSETKIAGECLGYLPESLKPISNRWKT
jgi:hypothetical protein